MKTMMLPAIGLAFLVACGPANGPASSGDTPAPITTLPSSIDVNVNTPPAAPDLPHCPGINPDIKRPPGSNCLGITPDQCGAERVQDFVGRQGTPELRKQIADTSHSATGGSFRWIPYGKATTDDLVPNRINVRLDQAGVIAEIDCS